MTKQSVMFKFRDVLKELKLGDQVFISGGRSHRQNIVGEVVKIGHKFVTVKYGGYGEDQFYIENGQQKSDYTPNQLYSSESAYNEYHLDRKAISALKEMLGRSAIYDIKKSHVLAAVKALNLEKEFKIFFKE